MSNHFFDKLNLEERAGYLCEHGELIGSIEYYGRRAHLFVLDNLYIELSHNCTNNVIEEVSILDPTERRLALYTANINIDSAF